MSTSGNAANGSASLEDATNGGGSDGRTRPVMLAVVEAEADRDLVVGSLRRRFGADYAVLGAAGPGAAYAQLESMRDAGDEVALIAASQWMAEETGTSFLGRTRELYPTARRLALAVYYDASALTSIARASTLGEIDAFEGLPTDVTDERFLSTVGDILADWAREHGRPRSGVTIVGRHDHPESQFVSDVLQRWDLSPAFLDAESPEGRALLAERGLADQLPVIELPDHRIVARATIAKVVEAFGWSVDPPSTGYDVAVLGLGPAGLSAAMNAASEGLRVMMVEPGFSQASSSPMIRNYLGFPVGVRGAELQRRAYIQAILFGAQQRIGPAARDLRREDAGLSVTLDDGSTVRTRSVVLATGVAYRRIGIPSVDGLVGRGVFYTFGALEAQALAGESAVVVGGANSAAQAAVHLARYARRVVLLVRGEGLSGSVSRYLLDQLDALPNVEVHLNAEIAEARDPHGLRSLVVRDRSDGSTAEIEATGLFILIGSAPRTEWLPAVIARDEHGFILTGADVPASGDAGQTRLPLETSMPGVFAAGDVRHGSVKRVAAAVGEGAEAITQVHRLLGASSPVPAGSA